MAKDYDPDEIPDGCVVTMRCLNYIATCIEQYLQVYEVVNNDPSISYEERKEACKKLKKVVKNLRKGNTKYLNMKQLSEYAPMLEQEAMNAERENDFSQVMGLNG